ncbi:MAG TPA: ABC transporter ATP-binding protein [Burkholderiaceae bacterium]|nr:ABC transporter ATP-binding protein [Burkholderiaceae bacterium]
MTDVVLQLERVGVRFGGLAAVDDVSMSVTHGERRAVIGPNGAGKTTLFNAITGMHPPTSGRIVFSGEDVTRMKPNLRAHRGMSRTFQITNLFQSMTVIENMQLALNGLRSRRFSMLGSAQPDAESRQRIEAALAACRLAERRNAVVRELSYGEQRQLEMAMSLVAQPRLLLLDEPAAGLSPAERSMITEIIRSLPRELTVMLIEHDMDLVLNLVDFVTCLNNGQKLVEAPPAEIRTNQQVQDVYLGKARRHA